MVVHEFITLGTVDQRIHEMLGRKRQLSAAVIGSEAQWLLAMDAPTLLSTLAPSTTGEETVAEKTR